MLAAATLFIYYKNAEKTSVIQEKTKKKSLSVVENDVIILTLTFPENNGDIFEFKNLNRVYKLNLLIEKMKGIKNISSLVGASVVTADEDEIIVRPFIPIQLFLTENEKKIDQLRETYSRYPELKPFISRDLSSCSFYIEPGKYYSSIDLYDQLIEIQKEYKEKNSLTFEFTGLRPIKVVIEKYLTEDILYFLPIIFLLIILLFYLNFSNIRVILLSLFILILTSIFSYFAALSLNLKITPLIVLIPAFNTGLLTDYLVHFFYHTKGLNTENEIHKVRNKLVMPLLLTAISTIIGFMSMMLLASEGHKFLGLFTALCIILTYLLTIIWLPKAVNRIAPQVHSVSFGRKDFLIKKITDPIFIIFNFLIRYKKLIYIISAFFILLSLYFVPRIIIQPYPVHQIPETSTIRKAEKILNKNFAGTIPFTIQFDTKENRALLRKNHLDAIEKVHKKLSENGDIGYDSSLITIIKRINYYFNSSDPEYHRIPDQDDDFLFQSLIEQYLIFYSTTASPEEYESLTDPSFRLFSINGVLKYTANDSLDKFLETISDIESIIPQEWEFEIRGPVSMLIKQSADLRNNWIFSFVVSLSLIFLTVLIYYRNLKLSLISMFPSLLSVFITTGFIALFNIEIDIYTIIFIAITMGLTIDYTIHVIVAIKELEKRSGVDQVSIHDKDSIRTYLSFIINYSGLPVFLSFLTSIFSFGILMLSSFEGARNFGLIISLSLIISIAFSVLILPVLLIKKS